jgi:hypothetical protein
LRGCGSSYRKNSACVKRSNDDVKLLKVAPRRNNISAKKSNDDAKKSNDDAKKSNDDAKKSNDDVKKSNADAKPPKSVRAHRNP